MVLRGLHRALYLIHPVHEPLQCTGGELVLRGAFIEFPLPREENGAAALHAVEEKIDARHVPLDDSA